MREGGGRLVRGAPVLRGTAWALVLFLGFLATVAGNTVNVRGILALTAGDGAITGGVLSSSQSATLRLALGDTVPDSTVLILAQRARDPAHDVGFEVPFPASAKCPATRLQPILEATLSPRDIS